MLAWEDSSGYPNRRMTRTICPRHPKYHTVLLITITVTNIIIIIIITITVVNITCFTITSILTVSITCVSYVLIIIQNSQAPRRGCFVCAIRETHRTQARQKLEFRSRLLAPCLRGGFS